MESKSIQPSSYALTLLIIANTNNFVTQKSAKTGLQTRLILLTWNEYVHAQQKF